MNRKLSYISVGFSLAIAGGVQADFTPLNLTPESFTHDIVVEAAAPRIRLPFTTASMDNGTANTAWGWYEQGYNPDAPETGLPVAGSTVTSESLPDHIYQLAASYTNSNAFLVDAAVTNSVLTVTTPAAYSSLSFLTAAGAGQVTVGYAVTHQDGTIETGTFLSGDWFNGENHAVTANGRVDVGSLGFGEVSSGNPRLYSADVTLSNTASPITNVRLTYGGGGGHAAIFAVSGSTGAGFSPIAVTGFNRDLVIEATADRPLTGLNATTASMDAGTGNTGSSWYEIGYNPSAAITGLPAAGTTITNNTGSVHVYRLPASYTTNNALIIDSATSSGSLVAATPAAFVGLSFLTSAGAGQVVIGYTVHHADGTTETGTFTSQDWFNNMPVAYTTRGRVDVVTGGLSAVNEQNPRLYAADVVLTNTTSPVTRVDLTYNSGEGHAAILAVSGAVGGVAPIFNSQPVSVAVNPGTAVQLTAAVSGSDPIRYQWQRGNNGAYANVTEGGNIAGSTTASLSINSPALGDAGSYLLIASNAFGSVTSQVARVTVLSSTPDITSPEDTITRIGGTAPAAEEVAMAIDNTTSKYLNFGSPEGDQASPFVGPAGLVIIPTQGAAGSGTVVTGLRVYAANDVPARDPIDYVLEGSNDDGVTFAQISAGALTLPEARNAGGLELDPLTQSVTEVLFSNNVAYKTYRLQFTNVRDNAAANSVQVGEIELLGTVGTGGPNAQLTIAVGQGGSLTLTSTEAGTLQSTTILNGSGTAWQDEGPISGTVTVTPTGTAKFYRVVVSQ